MEVFQAIGAAFAAVGKFARNFFWRSRQQDRYRLDMLFTMRDKLRSINRLQSRPENRRTVEYLYEHRKLIADKASVEQIESAYEMICRNRRAVFEQEQTIANLINQITMQIAEIDTR